MYEDMNVFTLPLGSQLGCMKLCCFLSDWGHLGVGCHCSKKYSGHFQQASISEQNVSPVNLWLIPKNFFLLPLHIK
jgi:hypothetical protein